MLIIVKDQKFYNKSILNNEIDKYGKNLLIERWIYISVDIELATLIVQAFGLISIIALIYTYLKDKRWKRTEAAYKFYNEYDGNIDVRLAMFMIDYGKDKASFKFNYDLAKFSEEVLVQFDYSKLISAVKKPYGELTEEEQVIRYILDVYIGYIERIFYCVKTKYFKENELIFYKYWLDILISDEFEEIRYYAIKNSCGLFVPYLKKYQNKIKPKIEKKISKISPKLTNRIKKRKN